MDTSIHNMNNLFAQLGLPDNDIAVEAFVREHHLESNVRLDQANFWSTAQATFIREALQEDSDWSEMVDQLDARLRH